MTLKKPAKLKYNINTPVVCVKEEVMSLLIMSLFVHFTLS